MNDLTGQTLSEQYRLEKRIGSGGMADVYKAWDSARTIYMAVKVLHTELANNPRVLEMFDKEASFLKQLGHPNIARLYEFRRFREFQYLVLEWIDGPSLDKILKSRQKALSLDEISTILSPVCTAVHYLHVNNVLHCDIKPGNILIGRNKRIYLADLGVARLISSGATGGTPPYMAPEQFQSGTLSPKTDIYALGITVYELLSGGRVPFSGTSSQSSGSTLQEKIAWEHINLPIPPIRKINRDVSEGMSQVIERALAKNPAQRYPSSPDFYNAFEAAKLGLPVRADDSRTQFAGTTVFLGGQADNGGSGAEASNAADYSGIDFDTNFDQAYRGQQRLIGLKGDLARKIILVDQNQLTLGRNQQNHILLSDMSVSRFHALLFKADRVVFIKDNDSSLGTIVNHEKIQGMQRLKHGDVIQIGHENIFVYRDR